jgi:hypothetical protein
MMKAEDATACLCSVGNGRVQQLAAHFANGCHFHFKNNIVQYRRKAAINFPSVGYFTSTAETERSAMRAAPNVSTSTFAE